MLDTGLPCFHSQTIKLLRARFSPQSTDKEAAAYMLSIIRNSILNFRTFVYNLTQYYQNKFPVNSLFLGYFSRFPLLLLFKFTVIVNVLVILRYENSVNVSEIAVGGRCLKH